MTKVVFVAAPYFDLDKKIIEQRVHLVSRYCTHLLSKKICVLSPIVFGSTILEHFVLPNDFSYWDNISYQYIDLSTEVHILMLNGWSHSRGIKNEMIYAKQNNKNIVYISQNSINDLSLTNRSKR